MMKRIRLRAGCELGRTKAGRARKEADTMLKQAHCAKTCRMPSSDSIHLPADCIQSRQLLCPNFAA